MLLSLLHVIFSPDQREMKNTWIIICSILHSIVQSGGWGSCSKYIYHRFRPLSMVSWVSVFVFEYVVYVSVSLLNAYILIMYINVH